MLTTAMRPVRCRAIGCQNMLMRRTINHRACSVECAKVLVDIKNAKEAARIAKVERRDQRERREALKTRSDWIKDAQVAFNAYIRARDHAAGHPCISCGRHHQGKWNAGHYLSTGARPELRFDEANVHLQCETCNTYLHGNLALYRINLIARIGLDQVERLEGHRGISKLTVDEIKALRDHYRVKTRELEKQHA